MDVKKQIITACAFIYKDGRVLIGKRAYTKQFLPGKYELPGGHIEFGEKIEEGLKRELREEFHVDIEVKDPCYIFTYINKDEHTVEIGYFADIKNPNQQITVNLEDHSEYRWVSEDELDKYFKDGDQEKIAIQESFRKIKTLIFKSTSST